MKKEQETERQEVEEEIIEKELNEAPVETVKKEEVVETNSPKSDIVTKMKELAELKDAGIISEEEFLEMKKI